MTRGWSLLIGSGCLVAAWWLAGQSIEFRRDGEVVLGTVTSVDARLVNDDDGWTFSRRAVVHYTPNGSRELLTLNLEWSSLWSSLEAGDSLAVRYLPRKPGRAREDSLLQDFGFPLVLLAVAVGGFTGRLQWASQGDDD